MKERAYTFGAHGHLVGIVTEPAGTTEPGRPAVLLANVGLNHRVGPNRLWVDLARRLAQEGFLSLRFDLGGFGDSAPRLDGGSDEERAVADFKDAMDFLAQKKRAPGFLPVGLCSGVDPIHVLARDDARVEGAAFIDGYCYRTPGFWLRYYTVRNLQPGRWRRYLWLRRGNAGGARRETGDAPEVFTRVWPTRERCAADLDAMLARGVALRFVYTGGWDNLYNYRGQFHDTFGHRGRVSVEYQPRADHLFTAESERVALIEGLTAWALERFPARVLPAVAAAGQPEVA